MPTVNLELQKNGTMSKAKEKSAKKRVAEDDDDQLPIFDKDVTEKDDVEESDVDLSDSEESVFSGLEDSGSDSDDDEEDGEDDEDGDDEDEDDGYAIISNENMKECDNAETSIEPTAPESNTSKSRDGKSLSKEKRKLKGQGLASEDGGETRLTSTFQNLTTAGLGDEYEHDTSDEEDIRNTVGNIPMDWYKDYPHIGYDLDGKKIFKPIRNKDELDEFLDKMENPDYWRTVHDKTTASDIRLTDEQIDLVHRLQKGQFGDVNVNEFEPSIDFFTNEVMIHPVTNRPQDKRSFIPSLIEKEKVSKMVHAIKMGWIKPRKPKDTTPKYYDLWAQEDHNAILGRHKMHVPAPKMRLPGHEESYNPPPEYLLTEEERLAWEQQDPEYRKLPFLPQRYACLRAVPAFSRFIHERFERCLDLYLCPRQRKMRVNVDPEALIPKLPKPKDLQPFPTTMSLVYRGHTSLVRSISASPTGQWLASGSDDCTVRIWEVNTGRCLKTLEVGGAVKCVAWNPNPAICLVAICFDSTVLLLNPSLGDRLVSSSTDQLISSYEPPEEDKEQEVVWALSEGPEHDKGHRLTLTHPKPVKQLAWHGKGDYLSSVMPANSSSLQVLIHQVSRRRTQNPFRRNKGLVQCVSFHPVRPYFFVATQRYVRVYNLIKQELTKKLTANCKWISSMAIHPGGDNLICGSYDCRLAWFDLDLSTKPYKMLRHHKKALRGVAYHKHYPLFASGADDGTVIVCHGMVYNDLLQNPLIVPVKVLKGHQVTHDLGVLDVTFHPTQPWVFSSGSDSTVRLFT
ncbi:hypothetical protein UPYG_G00333380 [Umbra pygmaea]|uniref:Ribosome biogenesis protein BOP1 n=1 Tax=Umbra pygmaea TaxID=75934 RepID=A0ABD0VWS9_UMBPY